MMCLKVVFVPSISDLLLGLHLADFHLIILGLFATVIILFQSVVYVNWNG